jgi:glycosyltransferase involved in cell wall biosynthesis
MKTRPIYFDRDVYRYANRFCNTWFESVKDTEDVVLDLCQDDIYLSLDLNMHLTAQVQDTYAYLRNHGIPLYFIVYDLLPVHRPDWWPCEIGPMFRSWLAGIGEVAKGLICISQAVADEMAAWLQSNPPQRLDSGPWITNFHLGADVHNSLPSLGMPISAEHVLAELEARTSFLMVGTLEPRKGHSQTLAAFERLWHQGIKVNLVIVGKQGWQVDELVSKLANHPERGKHLFWLEGISDEYLERVYAASSCLIAASEGEGFGLPLIEAAQHKKPIVARDIPVFREVAGEYAYYFTGVESEALARAIRNWLDLHLQNLHPKSDNMPWLTWRDSAEQIKRIVREPTPNAA